LVNKLVLENLKHRWLRTILSILAISISVTMVLTLVGLSRGVLGDQAARTTRIGADILIRPPGSSALSYDMAMPTGVLTKVEEQPHVAAASGVLIQGTGFLTSITGIDLPSFTRLSGGFHFRSGGPFQKPDDLIIDEFYARQHRLHVGDLVPVANRPWHVCGIVESGMLARMFVQLSVLQDLYSSPNKLSIIYVKLDNPARTDAEIEAFKALLKDYPVYSMEEYTSLFTENSIPLLKQFTVVIIALGVLVGFLFVFLSMYTAVLERTREIGILKALGASPLYVLNILIRETIMLALAGSVLGIVLSYGTQFVIKTTSPGGLIQAIVPDWWLRATCVALGGALLGAIYPGYRAARQDAIEALAYD
jgi:putative ABC transport system permease protein